MSPRCGKRMRRHETPAIIAPPGSVLHCGRPRGHNGPCRSTPSVGRAYAARAAKKRAERYLAVLHRDSQGSHYCRTPGSGLHITADPDAVTCRRCLRMLAGIPVTSSYERAA